MIPARKIVLLRVDNQTVAFAGIETDGLVDGVMVVEWGARDGEYQYSSVGAGLKTVALYRAAPAISLEAFMLRRESAYPKIAEARAAARQATLDAARAAEEARTRELRAKDEASVANARRAAEAEQAKARRLHRQYRMK